VSERRWVDCTCILNPADGTPCKTCGGSGGWFTGERMTDRNRMTPERRADIMGCVRLVEGSPDTRGETTLAEFVREALMELDAMTAERDAEKERAAWSIRTADTRWRQLDAVRERVSVQLLSIDTLARNVKEYPDRIPLLIDTIESLYARVQDGSIASLPTHNTNTTAPRE
jgi:hypothetical protein